ncbi:MAG TPA: hypothetical protein VGJ63_11815 [Micromonosporaceae bacterium]|jgi:hypothetical protein
MTDPWPNVDPWSVPAAAPVEDSPPADTTDPDYLLDLVDKQAALIVATGTGGPSFDSVNDEYKTRRKRLRAGLRARGLEDPFPFEDLWAWYGYYSQHLPTYAQRRTYVRGLAQPVREALERLAEGVRVEDPGAPATTTWKALEGRVRGIASELATASNLDDLQDVGRRCREVLIDVGKLLADPFLVPEGQEAPQAGNAKAWLDHFLRVHAGGRSHRELRAFVPTTWDLAQKVTHGDIDRVDAYAAAQATVLLVRVLQQLRAGVEDGVSGPSEAAPGA